MRDGGLGDERRRHEEDEEDAQPEVADEGRDR